MVGPLAEGELVLLAGDRGDSLLLRLKPHPQTVEGRGVLDAGPAIGQAVGFELEWLGARFRVVRPTLADLLAHLRRKAQIVTPKDAQFLLLLGGVGPGVTVLEAGSGSGALTLVLAHAVGPAGRVVSFDRRPDFLEVARKNLEQSGLADRVEFRRADVAAEGFGVTGADSVILDLPEPWAALDGAKRALSAGGSIAVYTPTYNQLERSVRDLRTHGFHEVRSVELLERSLHVGDGGTRPEFEMLGHTGFLTGARWMG
ncbi:MAG TPA: methyltransferase domain-containing protein [Thermoplasmata archaeon]|nr:methyltransferase domain-containing protein [Thermoplasmata archaeon]